MSQGRSKAWMVCALVVLAAMAAFAQQPGGGNQPGGGGRGGRGGPGGGGPGGGPGGPGGRGDIVPTSTCVAGDNLIVLRGNTIMQYDPSDLRQLRKATLPQPPAPADNQRRMPTIGSMAGSKSSLFVVWDNKLYQYNTSDLKVKAEVALPAPADPNQRFFFGANLLVGEGVVYVLRGNELVAYGDGLKQRAKATIQADQNAGFGGFGRGGSPLMLIGDCVFAVRGQTIYQFDAMDLKAQGKITLQ